MIEAYKAPATLFSRGKIARNRRSKQLGANIRLANAKSSMLHPGEQPEHRMHVGTYIPHARRVFFSPFGLCEGKHGTAHGTAPQKTMKIMKTKTSTRQKNPRPLLCNYFPPDWNTLRRPKTKIEQQSSSQPRTVAAPLATPSPLTRSG